MQLTIRKLFLALIPAVLVCIPLLQLAGCAGPSYYAQAVSGHLKLMHARENVSELLASSDTDPELANNLALSGEIRTFAVDQLGLPDNDSYTQLVRTGRSAVSWNVVAAPEFSIAPKQWCFLVSGCVSYRGYFEKSKAQKYAESLSDKGNDVTVSPAIAYSTLGWFDDPLLDTMFQYSDTQLAAFLFHELAHQQLYVKGDTAFSEAYASFVEEAGVQLWLQDRGEQQQLDDWRSMQTAAGRFSELVQQTREQLAGVYGSDLTAGEMRAGKSAALESMESAYRHLVTDEWNGRDYYQAWFARGLNNASLSLINSYQGGRCAFSSLFDSADRDIRRFHLLAADKAAMSKTERGAWLDQPCNTIASEGNL